MSPNLNGILLPSDVLWTDENDYSANKHSKKETAGGRLQVTKHKSQKGRPITLDLGVGVPDVANTPTYLMVKAFQVLRDADVQMSLTIADGRIFTVIFDHDSGHVEATPHIDYAVAEDGDFYSLILHLYEI